MLDRSPFPGMDPWLEASWGDVHQGLIFELRRQAVPQLPDGLFAVIEETVYLVEDDSDDRLYRPDVSLFSVGRVAAAGTAVAVGPAPAEPIRITLDDDPVTVGHIEIRRLGQGHPLVTVIEVLSPANKESTDGRAAYVEKRRTYRQAGVNLVEVDLLRGGRDLTGVSTGPRLDPRLPSAYRCCVRRWSRPGRPTLDLYPLPLRERLPAVAGPLRADDADLVLDLQPPIDLIYQLGGYGRRIDYAVSPDPPLSADDAAWAAACVAAAGR